MTSRLLAVVVRTLGIVSLLVSGATGPAHPTRPVCTVDPASATYLTIQSAIDDATCDPIEVATATYNETLLITRDVTIDASTGATVDAQDVDRVVFIDAAGVAVHLIRLTLANGAATDGAGIHNRGDLTIDASVIVGNVATGNGGGVYSEGSLTLVNNTVITSNEADAGAGIYNVGPLSITNSEIQHGIAASVGGGIHQDDGDLTMVGGSVSWNTAGGSGGGLHTRDVMTVAGGVTATISDSLFHANTTGSVGGGIYNVGTMTLTNVDVTDNIALPDLGGGGIRSDGDLSVIDSFISNNDAINGIGGGIYIGDGPLVVRGTWIGNNSAAVGAGIQAGGIFGQPAGPVTVEDSEIVDNRNARGIDSRVGLTLVDSVVRGNSAGGVSAAGAVDIRNTVVEYNTTSSDGGGLLVDGNATIENSTISHNTAANLGGGIKALGITTIRDTTIADNTAGSGGGLAVSCPEFCPVEVFRSTLSNNFAQNDGGGAWVNNYHLELSNSTISGNSANDSGGGVAAMDALVRFRSSTVARNDADADGSGDGGGVFVAAQATAEARNTIIADNDDRTLGVALAALFHDCAGAFTSQNSNLIGLDTGCSGFGLSNDQVGTIGARIFPRLRPLADNGGATWTHRLRFHPTNVVLRSPVIDTGVLGTTPQIDQRSDPRPVDGDGDGVARIDIGAFEVQ